MPNGNGEPNLQTILASQKIITSLDEVKYKIKCSEEDHEFLRNVLTSKEFRSLVLVHDRINRTNKDQTEATTTNAFEISEDVINITKKSNLLEAQELCNILSSPHLKAVLLAHDQIGSKDYFPHLPEIPHEVDEDEETVKIVQLVKSNEPLGATIKYDDSSGTVIIARIMHGGAADRSGLIHIGDEVHEVNGINVRGKTPTDVLHILEQSVDGTITFKLIPAEERIHSRESKVRVRAAFDFDPKRDLLIPCKDAGLPFIRGDVMHIVNQDDPLWWQARKEGDRNMRAGLIPGRLLQEQRITNERNAANDVEDDFDQHEIATYEEVARLYPRPGLYRPIVLIGSPGVGRSELKRRLLSLEPDHFKTTIPHTSRPPKPSEVDGKEYYFVSREYLEENIRNGKFIEHGDYKGNLYGTALETVKSIVNAGYACVMNPHPQALKLLRTSELKPYIIFIKPPPFERLKETRHNCHARSAFDKYCSRGFTDDEFNDIIEISGKIDIRYGHLFDTIILNEDINVAFEKLCEAVRQVELEPQWVPANWVQ